ncbi:hypothetical protein SAMN05444389_109131 [Paracoccus solventivorans]|uniref:Uncharacterized protein n=1 Tax=Paracoccus solventivorans TaxID=53463 RepID=A0A1M7IV33_9RHOB|nr:hypothetical protein [Paracoccus solventivorans]SHM44528.1 hypothetical protein SAMN05444389_109131 [Paracoccus solventivorans]
MAVRPERALALRIPEIAQSCDERDSILYAPGIGIGRDTADPGQLGFAYEGGLKAVPTTAAVI